MELNFIKVQYIVIIFLFSFCSQKKKLRKINTNNLIREELELKNQMIEYMAVTLINTLQDISTIKPICNNKEKKDSSEKSIMTINKYSKEIKERIADLSYQIKSFYNGPLKKDLPQICPLCKKGRKYFDNSCCRKFKLKGIECPFFFYDYYMSSGSSQVMNEIGKTIYDFSSIDFKNGDVIIDVGGNIGMTSIYLAKKYPFIKIISLEPMKNTYNNFIRNIVINNIPPGIIYVENKALNSNEKDLDMRFAKNTILSHSENFYQSDDKRNYVKETVKSITLEHIFKKYKIKKCKLLKMDCEGCEYEVLYKSKPNILKRIEELRMELHTSELTLANYGSPLKLIEYAKKYIKKVPKAEITGFYIKKNIREQFLRDINKKYEEMENNHKYKHK